MILLWLLKCNEKITIYWKNNLSFYVIRIFRKYTVTTHQALIRVIHQKIMKIHTNLNLEIMWFLSSYHSQAKILKFQNLRKLELIYFRNYLNQAKIMKYQNSIKKWDLMFRFKVNLNICKTFKVSNRLVTIINNLKIITFHGK